MNQPLENELLSAYLDGELSADEQARVDRLLAENPSARQFLDELRSLRSMLQSLPKQTLSIDLSEKVLKAAAERSSEQRRPRSRPTIEKVAERIKNNPRMVVWPLIVVTVAVLLMIFNPDQPGENAPRNIARTTTDQNAENPKDEIKLILPKDGEIADDKDQPSISAVEPPGRKPPPSQVATKGNPDDATTQTPPSAIVPPNLMVIECRISAESFAKQEYRKVFESNGIAIPEKSAIEVLRTTPSELAAATGIDSAILESQETVKIIAVEITPMKMSKILNQLQKTSDLFHDVSVKSASLPSTQQSPSSPPGDNTSATKKILLIFRVANP
jgi:negative regulator of sigma E activity